MPRRKEDNDFHMWYLSEELLERIVNLNHSDPLYHDLEEAGVAVSLFIETAIPVWNQLMNRDQLSETSAQILNNLWWNRWILNDKAKEALLKAFEVDAINEETFGEEAAWKLLGVKQELLNMRDSM